MACKLMMRRFFFGPEVISASKVLSFKRSPVTCFNTVADMAKYQEFVPWMRDIKLSITGPTTRDCELTIGYPPFTQSYLSKVTLDFPKKIVSLSNENDVFEIMESIWEFYPDPDEIRKDSDKIPLLMCQSVYSVRFKFKSMLYHNVSSGVLNMILNETSKAFVDRVSTLKNVDCFYDKKLEKIVEGV